MVLRNIVTKMDILSPFLSSGAVGLHDVMKGWVPHFHTLKMSMLVENGDSILQGVSCSQINSGLRLCIVESNSRYTTAGALTTI